MVLQASSWPPALINLIDVALIAAPNRVKALASLAFSAAS